MNTRILFKMCNYKNLIPPLSRTYGYKVIKRPDPKTFKYPTQGSAPSLMEIIKEKIRLNGPLTVAEYMHIIITNPTEGYYMKKDTIGEAGDFITSPEITQLFGEMMAIWFFSEYQKLGAPTPLQIVELGPGKGTLMVDFLRVLNRLRIKHPDLSLHLVEISETLINIQANRLCASHRSVDIDMPHCYEGETVSGINVKWYNDLKKVPKGFSWFIAHEFFDVLPIHKFEKKEDGWREIMIDLDEEGKLRYRIAVKETSAVKMLIRPPLNTEGKKELEISARSLGIARQLAERVDQDGGIALIADYGHDGEKEDTFRAFHKHQVVHPLEKPGDCDLTADVDFSQLRIAASKGQSDNYAIVVGPVTQQLFLQRCHAEIRLKILLNNAKCEVDREIIQSAYNMLIDPDKMGERFKFMAFYPSSMAEILNKFPPLGFSTYPTANKSTEANKSEETEANKSEETKTNKSQETVINKSKE